MYDHVMFIPQNEGLAVVLTSISMPSHMHVAPCTRSVFVKKEMDGLTDWDRIYFGSRLTCLAPAEGTVLPFKISEWASVPATAITSMQVLKSRMQPIPLACGLAQQLGAPFTVLPGIPATDIARSLEQEEEHVGSASSAGLDKSSGLNLFLSAPLIKVPLDHPNRIEGFIAVASGVRSALMKIPSSSLPEKMRTADDIGSSWVRLKGCGNNAEGFVTRVNHFKSAPSSVLVWADIRGCAFPHTATRELFYSGLLQKKSKVEDDSINAALWCANEPLALLLYSGQSFLPMGPEYPTACAVMKTSGDRRLGTHLLTGLRLLLPLLIDETGSASVEAIVDVFPDARPGKKEGVVSDTAWLLSDYCMATASRGCDVIGVMGIQWPDLPRDNSTLVDLSTAAVLLSEQSPYLQPPPRQWTKDGSLPMAGAWETIWTAETVVLHQALADLRACRSSNSAAKTEVLPFLFSRLGREAGELMRRLHLERISWGTYQDAMCRREWDEWHCNAHANNYVVLPE